MSTHITYIGHATVLVKTKNHSFITDPNFSERVFHVKRHVPLNFDFEHLKGLSAIFVSHAHYDHLDIPSFKFFPSTIPIVMPQGLGKLLSKFVKNPIIELETGSEQEPIPGISITTFPVNHRGFRISGLTYRGCQGYVMSIDGERFFFPGDTGYRKDFADFKNIDVALLPIGPCRPEFIMRPRHLNPADAVQVFEEMGAKTMIPIHWGTFKLGFDPVLKPMDDFRKIVHEKNLHEKVKILSHGESFRYFSNSVTTSGNSVQLMTPPPPSA